ncbi:MAG: hypothetical protein GY940_39460 [bacterium]|nr:hypothetical protein [bacterium]
MTDKQVRKFKPVIEGQYLRKGKLAEINEQSKPDYFVNDSLTFSTFFVENKDKPFVRRRYHK